LVNALLSNGSALAMAPGRRARELLRDDAVFSAYKSGILDPLRRFGALRARGRSSARAPTRTSRRSSSR
jgi:hypothetical protein